jgi:hypothetical protein
MNANINDIETFNYLHRYICPCENMVVTEYTCLTLHKCCECGTEYNSAGRKLTPRSQWGEETGEHFY